MKGINKIFNDPASSPSEIEDAKRLMGEIYTTKRCLEKAEKEQTSRRLKAAFMSVYGKPVGTVVDFEMGSPPPYAPREEDVVSSPRAPMMNV